MFTCNIDNNLEATTLFHLATQTYMFTLWTAAPLFNKHTTQLLKGGTLFTIMLLNLCGVPPFPLFFVKFWLIGTSAAWSKLSLIALITLVNVLTTWLYLMFIKRISTINTTLRPTNRLTPRVHPNLKAVLFVWTCLIFINPWLFM